MVVLNPDKTLVLGFPEYEAAGRRLASALELDFALIQIHPFPDQESGVTLPAALPESVIFCRSLDRPNEKLIELILATETARSLGVNTITLVAPYLCYMRQDTAFHPGEAVSQQIIGTLLAEHIDRLITVDPHLHRVHTLDAAVPASAALALHADRPIADFLARDLPEAMLIGPDEESEQWVAAIAAHHGLDYAVATKHRLGDREVRITMPELRYERRDIVLIDDMASTGVTLERATKALAAFRPRSIHVVVTHALFIGDACERLYRAGVNSIWSTDSIPHSSNCISLADLLAHGIMPLESTSKTTE